MRTDLRWCLLRLAMRLSAVLPCSLTSRLRSAQTSYCYKNMWGNYR